MKETEKDRLIYTVKEFLTEEQCNMLNKLINDAQQYSWPDNERFKEIGYKSYDSAKPQPYIDKLHEMGLSYDMLSAACVYDYTHKSFGELSNWKQKYFEYIMEILNA